MDLHAESKLYMEFLLHNWFQSDSSFDRHAHMVPSLHPPQDSLMTCLIMSSPQAKEALILTFLGGVDVSRRGEFGDRKEMEYNRATRGPKVYSAAVYYLTKGIVLSSEFKTYTTNKI